MKSGIVIIIIAAATAIVSALCISKFRHHPNEMDLLGKSIAGLKTIIPEDRAFSIQLVQAKMEYAIFTRYFLAPRHASYPQINTDTVLIINNIHWNDSVMANVVNKRKIIWRSTDSANAYTLVCNQ